MPKMRFETWLATRLQKKLPGQQAQAKMIPLGGPERFPIPTQGRQSSVLQLLCGTSNSDDYQLIAIKRSPIGIHAGQIAFPGGSVELEDANLVGTALREAKEEINLNQSDITILGKLSPLYIPVSNFIVHPILAYRQGWPQGLSPSKAEVEKIISISMKNDLAKKEIHAFPTRLKSHKPIEAPCYRLGTTDLLWGASAMLLSELEALWDEFEKDFKNSK